MDKVQNINSETGIDLSMDGLETLVEGCLESCQFQLCSLVLSTPASLKFSCKAPGVHGDPNVTIGKVVGRDAPLPVVVDLGHCKVIPGGLRPSKFAFPPKLEVCEEGDAFNRYLSSSCQTICPKKLA